VDRDVGLVGAEDAHEPRVEQLADEGIGEDVPPAQQAARPGVRIVGHRRSG
jgi:hypothetical protein